MRTRGARVRLDTATGSIDLEWNKNDRNRVKVVIYDARSNSSMQREVFDPTNKLGNLMGNLVDALKGLVS